MDADFLLVCCYSLIPIPVRYFMCAPIFYHPSYAASIMVPILCTLAAIPIIKVLPIHILSKTCPSPVTLNTACGYRHCRSVRPCLHLGSLFTLMAQFHLQAAADAPIRGTDLRARANDDGRRQAVRYPKHYCTACMPPSRS